MFDLWNNIIIKDIQTALYVPPGSGRTEFLNRLFHGLVLNDSFVQRDYIFSDGTVLHTKGNDLFYLPKGSDYRVNSITSGGCYAINFDAQINDTPFLINMKKGDALRHFKHAANVWQHMEPFASVSIRAALYDIILLGAAEQMKKYTPSSRFSIILPAEEIISKSFCDNSLSVTHLARECNISEAYFRRIFTEKYNMSPKEYIISQRIKYACQLLSTGEFSVLETANLCGYYEQCHFSREFSKRMGISPRQYKENPEH